MILMYKKIIFITLIVLCNLAFSQQENKNTYTESPFNYDVFSVGVGYASNDMRYINNKAELIFDYQVPNPTILISSDNLFINISYGNQKASLDGEASYKIDMKLFECSIISGPNINLFNSLYDFPFSAYIPLRLNLRYNFILFEGEEIQEYLPELHLLNTEIGIGIGIKIIPFKNLNWQLFFSSVSSIGSLFCIRQVEINENNLTRSLDVNFELTIPKFLSQNFGVTFGYSYKMLRWTDDQPVNSKFIFQSISNVGSLPKRRGQNIFWIGINF